MVRRRGGTPGGYDPGGGGDSGGSDDSGGIDPSDPSTAPSARGSSGGGIDADDPRDAPSARGGGFDGGSDDDDPGFDPGDPADAPSARGGDTSGDAGATVEVGPSTGAVGPVDRVEAQLDAAAQAFDQNVAEPAGDIAATVSPSAQVTDAIAPGTPGSDATESRVTAGVNAVNPAAIASGAVGAGQRVVRDTGRTLGGEGGEVVDDAQQDITQLAAGAAQSARTDPVEFAGAVGGGLAGGAIGGTAVVRGVSRARAASGSSTGSASGSGGGSTSGGAVATGRSQVGTGGRGSLLDEIDVDAERGISGPSTASRVRGEVSRTVDDVTDSLGSGRLGEFVEDTRGQLQTGRQRSPDTGDTVDRTRPADAGGTFEDVRQDALTQIQDDLRGRGERPDPGTFDDAPDPFRPGGGDTIDPDAGVQLQRSTATAELGAADDVTAATTTAATRGAAGFGAGLGVLAVENDPTGIAPTTGATGAGSASRSDSDATPVSGIGTLAGVTDPSDILSPTDRSGTDTTTATGVDTGTTLGSGSGDLVGGDTATGATTDRGIIEAVRGATDVGATGRVAGTAGLSDTDVTVGDPELATQVGRGGRPGGGGVSPPSRTRPPDIDGERDDEEEPPVPLFGLDADAFGTGFLSGEQALAQSFGRDSRR